MLANLRPALTFANVVSLIALFVALGGSGYAAVVLKKNSVKSAHIKNGQVKTADLARNSVSTSKIANGRLRAEDFASGQLPAGPAGARGANGATKVVVRSATGGINLQCSGVPGPCVGQSLTVVARCNDGERATGGGYGPPRQTGPVVARYDTENSGQNGPFAPGGTPTGWVVDMKASGASTGSPGSFSGETPPVYVVCAAP